MSTHLGTNRGATRLTVDMPKTKDAVAHSYRHLCEVGC